MKLIIFFIISFLNLTSVSAACFKTISGEVKCTQDRCLNDRYGNVVCSPTPGGNCAIDKYGDVVCGKGECLQDRYGKVVCSASAGGGCAANKYGEVICN